MLLLEKADLFKHSTAKTQHVVHTRMEASFTANSTETTGLPTMWEFTASYFSYVKGKRQLGVKQVSLIFHNWRNSQTKNKQKKKSIKNWQFYCPIKRIQIKVILSTIIRHQHSTLSTGGGKEKVWSFIFAYFLYWSIHYHFFMETRRLVVFSCLFSLNEWKKTMKLSTCMWPHWVRGWEEETGTDHQLQHTQWKSLIASHFRLKGGKKMMRNLECTSLEKWHWWRSGKYTSFFFFSFLNTLQEGEERRGVAARCSQVGSSKGATFFWQYYKHLGC